VISLEPLDAKLSAFGFHVVTADGHDIASLLAARGECTRVLHEKGPPVAIIANTIKGHGIHSVEDSVDSHYLPMDDTQYEQALAELALLHAAVTGHRNEG